MKAVQHFATQPAVTAALATGGLVAAIAKIPEQRVYKRLTAGYPVVTVAKHLEREIVED